MAAAVAAWKAAGGREVRRTAGGRGGRPGPAKPRRRQVRSPLDRCVAPVILSVCAERRCGGAIARVRACARACAYVDQVVLCEARWHRCAVASPSRRASGNGGRVHQDLPVGKSSNNERLSACGCSAVPPATPACVAGGCAVLAAGWPLAACSPAGPAVGPGAVSTRVSLLLDPPAPELVELGPVAAVPSRAATAGTCTPLTRKMSEDAVVIVSTTGLGRVGDDGAGTSTLTPPPRVVLGGTAGGSATGRACAYEPASPPRPAPAQLVCGSPSVTRRFELLVPLGLAAGAGRLLR